MCAAHAASSRMIAYAAEISHTRLHLTENTFLGHFLGTLFYFMSEADRPLEKRYLEINLIRVPPHTRIQRCASRDTKPASFPPTRDHLDCAQRILVFSRSIRSKSRLCTPSMRVQRLPAQTCVRVDETLRCTRHGKRIIRTIYPLCCS